MNSRITVLAVAIILIIASAFVSLLNTAQKQPNALRSRFIECMASVDRALPEVIEWQEVDACFERHIINKGKE